MIPQFKPWIDRESLAKEVNDYILSDGYFMEFKNTELFEKELAKFLGVKYCSVVSNGTISLSLALLAQGVKPGDKVLIPNVTMMATQSAVTMIGAVPVFIDIEPNFLCMNLKHATTYIENNPVKAVIYVTLNGRSHGMGELGEFYSLCRGYKIGIIEDNAQSLGSRHNDNSPISCPQDGIGSFSFSMPKIITTGQGGCLVTDVDYYGETIKKMKDFGRVKPGVDLHDQFGTNAKFTEIQAIMGLNQMSNLEYRIYRKKLIFNQYHSFLSSWCPDRIEFMNMDSHTCPWFVDIYVDNREALQEYLKDKGIGTRIIYPPLTSQKINDNLDADIYELYPRSKMVTRRGLWLPSYMQITKDEILLVCKTIKEFYEVPNQIKIEEKK